MRISLAVCLGLWLVAWSTAYGQVHVNGAGFDPTPVTIPTAAPTPRRAITSMDLVGMRDLHGVSLSPDGRSVAFVLGQAVYETNSYRTGLFVVDTARGSVPVSLGTAGPPRWTGINEWAPEAPAWSPDSRFVAYRLMTEGRWQIWRWDRDGRGATQLTHSAAHVESFHWSADGRTIAFVVQAPVDPHEASRLEERGVLYDGRIRAWELRPVVDEALERERVPTEAWIYDVASGAERRASPDEREPADWEQRLGSDYADSTDQLNGKSGHILYPKLSPDGRRVIYQRYIDDPAQSGNVALPLYVQALGGPAIALTHQAAYALDYWWSPDSRTVYYTESIGDGRARTLFVVSATGDAPARRLGVDRPGEWFDEYSIDANVTHAACVHATNTTPDEVALIDFRTGAFRTLVNVNPEFQRFELSPATRLEWTNRYGVRTHGYLVLPLHYVEGKRYPLIVTTYRSGDYFLRGGVGDEYPIQVFAANGFAVLAFDAGPRPNIGEGDFARAIMDWRWPMASLESGLAKLDSMGIVDPNRRGLSGLSHGSEITMFTISHSDLFQAAIVSGGGSRDPYFYYMSGLAWWKLFAHWGLGWPEGPSAAHWHELAPSLNAERITAPLLSNAAETEYIVGLSDYVSLRQLGKPAELFIYPRELHIKNQPKHRYEIYERNVDWFKFWLQNAEDPDPKKREQYERWRSLRNERDSLSTQR